MMKPREAFLLGVAEPVTETASPGGVLREELRQGSPDREGTRILTKERAGLGLKTKPRLPGEWWEVQRGSTK